MFNEYPCPLPRWELTDPFGRAALKGLRFELRKALAERDEYRIRCEEILAEQGKAVKILAHSLETSMREEKELRRRLQVCDEARSSLGDKNRAAASENGTLRKEIEKLCAEKKELEEQLAQLREDHEKLVRCMADKEAEL